MRNLYIIGLITFFIWSCNSVNNDKNQQFKNNDSFSKNSNNELTTQIEEPVIESNIEIIDTIKNHQLGTYRIGDTIVKVINKLKSKYIIQYDSISQNEENTSYLYYYLVSDHKNLKLFKLYAYHTGKFKNCIIMIEVLSKRFITNRGIKIGDKVSDLKKKYTITEADFNYEDGLWLFAKEFSGGFRLDFNEKGIKNFDYENPKPDNIPEQIRINGIMIH